MKRFLETINESLRKLRSLVFFGKDGVGGFLLRGQGETNTLKELKKLEEAGFDKGDVDTMRTSLHHAVNNELRDENGIR